MVSGPPADAVVVRHGRIVRVGMTDDLSRDLPAGCPRVSLDGAVLLPAFVDAHVHLYQQGLRSLWIDLTRFETTEELLAEVRRHANGAGGSSWILGRDWDESRLATGRPPGKAELDDVAPEHPVLLRRICGHTAVINHAALALLDLNALERERARAISRDGVLLEKEVSLVTRQIPLPEGERVQAVEAALAEAVRQGVTRIGEIVSTDDALRTLSRVSSPLEMVLYLGRSQDRSLADQIELATRKLKVRIIGLKVFMDGSLGARTAALAAPYADDPGTGLLLRERRELEEILHAAQENLLQVAVHAIGDAAVETALQAFEKVNATSPVFSFRHRLEHAVLASPDHLERAARLGISLCMQPNFIRNWSGPGGLYEERLGDRAVRANPLGSILRAGVSMGFGSDCMPLGPLHGLAGAVSHPHPEERLTLEQALAGYTTGAARLLFQECRAGRIQPGMEADLVVLSPETLEAPEEGRVLATYRRGKLVHSAV